MLETEVKVLEINKEEVEKQVIKLGAKKVFEGELYAIYYDSEDGKLSKNKNVIRLRKEGEKTKFTLKVKQNHDKASVNEEHEIEVSDFEKMKTIFEFLGFKNIRNFRKTRESYKLGNVRFEFDKYHDDNEHIPWFIELESDNYNDIKLILEKLNIPEVQTVKMDAFELIDYYQSR
jgi:adenylate cyclase, class 2